MTPREVKDALYDAAVKNDEVLALLAAREFHHQKLWTSTPHYDPIEPDGTEKLIRAARPGTCCLCHTEFRAGTDIRWRSRVDCHVDCWNKKFGT